MEFTITDKTTETVYMIVSQWLQENNIPVTNESKPNMIEVKHGKRIQWKFNALEMERTYNFLINESGEDGTILRVVMDTPWHNKQKTYLDRIKRAWHQHLITLWTKLGIELEEEQQKSMYGISSYYDEIQRNSMNMYFGLLGFFACTIIILYGMYLGEDWEIIRYVSIGGAVQAIMSWNSVVVAKGKLKDFDEEERRVFMQGVKADSNRLLKTLTLVSLVVVVGFGYWVFTQPYYVTCNGMGYSFEYPRTWSVERENVDIWISKSEIIQCKGKDARILVSYFTNITYLGHDVENLWNDLYVGYQGEFDSCELVDEGTYSGGEHEFITKELVLTYESATVYFYFGFTSDLSTDRIYSLSYYSEDEAETSFKTLLDSFQTV